MPYFPDFATFADLARSHTMVPVYRQLLGDTLTPVTAFTQIEGVDTGKELLHDRLADLGSDQGRSNDGPALLDSNRRGDFDSW